MSLVSIVVHLYLFAFLVVKILFVFYTLKVSGKDQLCDILQKTSNITYFEPAGYNRDSVIAQHKVACRRPTHSTVVIELFAFQR